MFEKFQIFSIFCHVCPIIFHILMLIQMVFFKYYFLLNLTCRNTIDFSMGLVCYGPAKLIYYFFADLAFADC